MKHRHRHDLRLRKDPFLRLATGKEASRVWKKPKGPPPRTHSKRRETGRYERIRVEDEELDGFIPRPLPVSDPPLALDETLDARLQAAQQALSRLG